MSQRYPALIVQNISDDNTLLYMWPKNFSHVKHISTRFILYETNSYIPLLEQFIYFLDI